MSQIRLLVREEDRDWSGVLHGGCADRAIGALSADPTTLEELEAACYRFQKLTENRPSISFLSEGTNDTPVDAGLLVIDLSARVIVMNSTYSSVGRHGSICYHDGCCATDIWLPYHLADDWVIEHDLAEWKVLTKRQREEKYRQPRLDIRKVLYGIPLLDYLATAVYSTLSAVNSTDETTVDRTIKRIHADWMLSPRDDLGGRSPREVLLEHRLHVDLDLQNQSQHWSKLEEPPPGLSSSTDAFQFGGFGTHELVEYYNLIRELLWSCAENFAETAAQPSASMQQNFQTPGDFLSIEVPRLERVREEWLDTPEPDYHGRTPRSIIDRERTRLPEGVAGTEAIVDPDCPCCQMLAELPGPVFWHLDGCEMDDDFAFDMYCETREEWEQEQKRMNLD